METRLDARQIHALEVRGRRASRSSTDWNTRAPPLLASGVPRERVRLRKEVISVNQEISEDVRKEEVTIERSGASTEPDGTEDADARPAP